MSSCAGNLAQAERRLATAATMAARIGDPMWAGPVAAAHAELDLWRGDPEHAIGIVERALALAPDRQCVQHVSEL